MYTHMKTNAADRSSGNYVYNERRRRIRRLYIWFVADRHQISAANTYSILMLVILHVLAKYSTPQSSDHALLLSAVPLSMCISIRLPACGAVAVADAAVEVLESSLPPTLVLPSPPPGAMSSASSAAPESKRS
jgi:hypothetical protein